jgi:hypothetical protein
MITARQIIANELAQWIDQSDYRRFGQTQRMEEQIGIWEYGKWTMRGQSGLGYKPQIKFRGSRPESTAWDSIVDISDDEGMRVHAATVGMESKRKLVLHKVYMYWQNEETVKKDMRISSDTFYRLRREALQYIIDRLE